MDDFNPNPELKVTKAMMNDRPTRKNRKHKKKNMSQKDKTAIKNLVKKLVAIERKLNAKIKNKKGCKETSIKEIVKSRKLSNIARRKRRGSKKKKKTGSDIAPPVSEQPSQVDTVPVYSNDNESQTEQPAVEPEPVNSTPETEVAEEPQSITPTEEPEKPKENSVLESVENSMSSVASAVGLGSNSAESEKKKEENKPPTGGRRRSKKGKGKGKK